MKDMDLDTREWFDGILTASARQVVKAAPHEQEWIVCDGGIKKKKKNKQKKKEKK